MQFMLLILVCLNLKISNVKTEDDAILQIEDGEIQGEKRNSSIERKFFYAFEGIPFAKPPLGNLRFLPPQPNEKWSGILDATKLKPQCVQGNGNGSEDCLYVNVFTPNLTKQNMSVMFSIYGGGFSAGSGKITPDFLLNQEDIVLVSFNYRVGVFGFICTGDTVLPGNAGLKDQVMALAWVQRNIEYFGGNPQDVTIFGESAGAASVGYHLQINQTKDMFHKAIMQSGNTLCPWALTRKCSEIAFALGKSLNIFTTSSTVLLQKLQKIDAVQLQQKAAQVSTYNLILENPLNGLMFGPVQEPVHEGAVFSENSHQQLSDGLFHKVTIMIGHNSQEAVSAEGLPDLLKLYFFKYDFLGVNLVPEDMNITANWLKSFVSGKIKYHYFGFTPVGWDMEKVVQFISDDQFNRCTSEAVSLYSKFVKVFFYVFSYKGVLGTTSDRTMEGVGHAEDVPYLFGREGVTPTSKDIITMGRMCKWWTNFAKFGDPTPEGSATNITWQPSNFLNDDDLCYLDIDENPVMKTNPNSVNLNFYKSLYAEHGESPFDTY